MSIFSSFGKAFKSVFSIFRKETREQIEKEARSLKPELKAGIDDEIRKHGLRKVRLRLRHTRSI